MRTKKTTKRRRFDEGGGREERVAAITAALRTASQRQLRAVCQALGLADDGDKTPKPGPGALLRRPPENSRQFNEARAKRRAAGRIYETFSEHFRSAGIGKQQVMIGAGGMTNREFAEWQSRFIGREARRRTRSA